MDINISIITHISVFILSIHDLYLDSSVIDRGITTVVASNGPKIET